MRGWVLTSCLALTGVLGQHNLPPENPLGEAGDGLKQQYQVLRDVYHFDVSEDGSDLSPLLSLFTFPLSMIPWWHDDMLHAPILPQTIVKCGLLSWTV